ncbi:MAG: Lrp/AsnC family transcriptional regulator [Actinomycetota bacterium]|nr:Lrp/AsnC family transcriptional regulator [Actinomycetota bacterium]
MLSLDSLALNHKNHPSMARTTRGDGDGREEEEADTSPLDSGHLDVVSKRIIEQLQEDGRRSYAAIARAVGLSEAATRLRVQRLLDDRIVQIVAVTDAAAIGFHRQAMLGINVEGDISRVADKLVGVGGAEYVVICAGRFDILVELICEDDAHLLAVVDEVRMVPGVRSTETFVYLKLAKENYQWGTR